MNISLLLEGGHKKTANPINYTFDSRTKKEKITKRNKMLYIDQKNYYFVRQNLGHSIGTRVFRIKEYLHVVLLKQHDHEPNIRNNVVNVL